MVSNLFRFINLKNIWEKNTEALHMEKSNVKFAVCYSQAKWSSEVARRGRGDGD